MNVMTEGQLKVIRMIEENTGIVFKGKTKEEARSFISENIEASKQSSMRQYHQKRQMWQRINEQENYGERTEEDYYDELMTAQLMGTDHVY